MVVSFVKELPIPSSRPATGRIAIGSIKDLPTRCKTPKILSFMFLCSPFPDSVGIVIRDNCRISLEIKTF
jgi:hypothetical protein